MRIQTYFVCFYWVSSYHDEQKTSPLDSAKSCLKVRKLRIIFHISGSPYKRRTHPKPNYGSQLLGDPYENWAGKSGRLYHPFVCGPRRGENEKTRSLLLLLKRQDKFYYQILTQKQQNFKTFPHYPPPATTPLEGLPVCARKSTGEDSASAAARASTKGVSAKGARRWKREFSRERGSET
jgi:hypothetical protein